MNITSLFLRSGDEAAITHARSTTSSTTRTSSELLNNVSTFSAHLQRLGVKQRDSVLILCGSRVEALESILAVMRAGAVAMPVNPMMGPALINRIIQSTHPACCIFEDPPEPQIERELKSRGAVMILLRSVTRGAPPGWHVYPELLQAAPGSIELPDCDPHDPALVIHSSGSSGLPKAVTMSQGELANFFDCHTFIYAQYSEFPGLPASKSPVVTGLPLSHLAGIATCLQSLLTGRHSYLMSFFLPESYLKLIEQLRCTFIMLVPSHYRRLLAEPYLKSADLSALRFCITGGEPCPVELMQRIEAGFGAHVVNAYSMTECLSGIAHTRQDLVAGRIPHGSCGRQLFGEVKLVDEHGRESRDVGELWVRNSTVHRCYTEDALNAERLDDGWFRTRDLFYRDARGEFFHRGRVDDMFICNGKNIYPIEIELLLLRHPAVEAAFAGPVQHPQKGTVPAAFIVPRSAVAEADLQAFCQQNGPSHIVPQILATSTVIPQLGAGKVDRREILRLLQNACESMHPVTG